MTEGKPDDFLSMKEVLTRRLNRLGEEKWAKPDLIIIDGGKGQLSSVMQIIEDLGVSGIDVVSLAKNTKKFSCLKNQNLLFYQEIPVRYFFSKE